LRRNGILTTFTRNQATINKRAQVVYLFFDSNGFHQLKLEVLVMGMIGTVLFGAKLAGVVAFGFIIAIAAAVLNTVKYNTATTIIPSTVSVVIMAFRVRQVRSLPVRVDTQQAPIIQQIGKQNPTRNRTKPVDDDFGSGAICWTTTAG
jgi:hypothetical protein